MGILGIGVRRNQMTKDQLLERKAFIESRLSQVTAKMANAKNPVVRERIQDRITMLNSRLDKINQRLSTMG